MTNKRFGALVACLSAALFLFGCSHDLDSIGLPGGDLTRDPGANAVGVAVSAGYKAVFGG